MTAQPPDRTVAMQSRSTRRTPARAPGGRGSRFHVTTRKGSAAGYSQDQVPIEFEVDVAQARSVEQGGMTLAFERLSAGVETAPLFKGLPDDACQSPHWGYVISGRLRIVSTDGSEETLDAGQAYYLPAGHNVVVEEDALLIEFSPAHERTKTMEHAAQMMQAAAGA
jgi:hypothetical protein